MSGKTSIETGARKQSGAALLVVLMLLLIVTLLGLASMRGGLLQERMAGATIQRGKAFQAAESALRQGEAFVNNKKPAIPSTGCAAGVCAETAAGSAPAWTVSTFWGTDKAKTATSPATDVSAKFVVESYGLSVDKNAVSSLDPRASSSGTDAEVYRVVARGESASGSEVLLQSIYRVKR
ncbi:pilus assembly PilX family protein [Thermomonas sp.]